ncbi:MAG: hypothetical protein WBA57_07520 [Elainellaceae cyanobacterium]
MTSLQPPLNNPFQTLRELRTGLLRLHKALLESERITYEQQHGRIQSQGEFFQLVLGDDWFGWLRAFSQFIVQIDEATSAKEPITVDEANKFIEKAQTLLSVDESGDEREQRYYQAIQRDPDIAFMHAETLSIVKSKR